VERRAATVSTVVGEDILNARRSCLEGLGNKPYASYYMRENVIFFLIHEDREQQGGSAMAPQVTELRTTAASTPSTPSDDPGSQLLLLATAGLSAGAAGIHFAVVPGHLAEDPLAGYFFIAVAIAQALWAILLSHYPRRQLLVVGAVANVLVAVLWLVVRVYGSPLGASPWTPEPFGFTDGMSAAFEVASAITVWVLCSRRRPPVRRLAGPALVLGTVLVALTSAALLNIGMVE
jgi:hypothetical protein